MPSDFVHLHLHTHYSLLDGACTPEGLAKLAVANDMPAMAITDHGFLGGAIDFHQTLSKAKVNPIIGCEAYIAPGSREDRNPTTPYVRGFHLLLLAENNVGYHNLCKLSSEAYRTGIYYKPRIDKELLRRYSEGLIGMSACIGGEIPAMILESSMDEAERALKEYLDIFGRNNFFLELMDHGLPEEKKSNHGLIELSKKFDIPLVATNDVHYQRREDARAHEIMLCVQTNTLLSDPKHLKFETPEFYLKTADEMKQLFAEVPAAVTNSRMIAERCEVTFKYAPEVNHYPVYKLEDGTVPGKDYLRSLCLENLENRYRAGDDVQYRDKIIARMDYELEVIENSGFCSYFLVVSDFIHYAKTHGIPVGPGRGSGAGSVVAYLSGITDIDPLRYDLLFERFLNPERISPPDFDIDFCENRREQVIDYVRDKYGSDSVAQICTYGTLKAKAVIKDVMRVLGEDFETSNNLSKLIPDGPGVTLADAIQKSPELKQKIDREPRVKEVFDYAYVLEGLNRQLGIHAAGVIIGDQALNELVPLARGAKGEIITQFVAKPCESLGLLKMDFLGLRTLTIIKNAVDLIAKNHQIKLDMLDLPLDDLETYKLLQRGDTVAIFQLESGGMQNLCRNFGVETIEHIIALLAIYRPGPMEFIPQFIRRKRGDEKIIYDHPQMEPILRETYGIMLYQEQIMQVVQVLAGFTLGGADILRRAIGKKDAATLAKQKAKFIEGCKNTNNISDKLANTIWEKIEMFAGYGFNKSHSAAYAILAYQTAYLKAHYPVEFMAAVLTSELDNADAIAFFISSTRERGIKILPPDVNYSELAFGVDSDSIRFGLGAIKGVGEGAASKIIETRERDGKFKNFVDFCERAGSALNSRMINNLARAGALDSLGLRRSQILAIAESVMNFAARKVADLAAGQGSLFDALDDDANDLAPAIPIPDIPEFDEADILRSEKELLGFYVTGHPLSAGLELVKTFTTVSLEKLATLSDGAGARIGGMINSYSIKYGKSGKPFGVLSLETLDGTTELVLYSEGIESIAENMVSMEQGKLILAEVSVSRRTTDQGETVRTVVQNVVNLDRAPEIFGKGLNIYLYENDLADGVLAQLNELCRRYPGDAELIVCLIDAEGRDVFIENKNMKITISSDLLNSLDSLLGKNSYKIKVKPYIPPPPRKWQSFEKRKNGY